MGADIFITEEEAGMTEYKDMGAGEMRELYDELARQYERYCALGLELNRARGKPSPAQLELSMPLLDCVNSEADYLADDGTDCRNYGVLAGLPEARALIADMLDVTPEQVVICGGSSLNIMFDTIARAWITGLGGQAPWSKLDHVKFICPSPGYDRHFAICEHFGIEMLPIELGEDGPDVAEIARLVADPAVKGIWCVPQYSNPCGYTYSDEVVRGPNPRGVAPPRAGRQRLQDLLGQRLHRTPSLRRPDAPGPCPQHHQRVRRGRPSRHGLRVLLDLQGDLSRSGHIRLRVERRQRG